MKKEIGSQIKVAVGVDPMWESLKDLVSIVPKIRPNIVQSVDIIEGDGGLGTIFLLTFGSGESLRIDCVSRMKYQKEKIVDFDESRHRIGLQVIEGGHLEHGFCFYKVTFQLTATEDKKETEIDILVEYQVNKEEDEVEVEAASMASKTTASAHSFIKNIESYLLQTHGAC